VSARLQQINTIQQPIPYEVALKELPQQTVVSIREVVPHLSQMGEVRDRLLRFLYQKLDDYGITPGTELALYNLQAYTEKNIDMSLAVEVAKNTQLPESEKTLICHQLPFAPLAASVVHHGTIWDVSDVVVNIYRWIGANG
jgi:effector-binding domain-containing protein